MILCTVTRTIVRPVSVNLPSLKELELSFVHLHDDFAQKLWIGCPSLEKLKVASCDLYFSDISSERLKELTFVKCHLFQQLQISCPNLVHLFMDIHIHKEGISLKNMPAIVNAIFKIYRAYTSPNEDISVLQLLGALSNSEKLEFYLDNQEANDQLEKDIPNCRNFDNLKQLSIGNWDMIYDFYLVGCLLKHSPKLEELNLTLNECRSIRAPRREVPGDVLFWNEYLEKVKIYDNDMYPHFPGKLCTDNIKRTMTKTLNAYVKKIGNVIIS